MFGYYFNIYFYQFHLHPGLNMARWMVESHCGTLEIDSEGKNKGMTVTVCLPVKQPEEADDELTA